MSLNTTAKGRDFEAEVATWLEAQGYNDVERNVRVEVSPGALFECDIHAHQYSLMWIKLRRIGILFFAIAACSSILNIKPIQLAFRDAVSAIDPSLASYALFIFGFGGWVLGMIGKKRTGHHVWVECKSHKVIRDHVVKLTHITDKLTANKKAGWYPRYVMIFSAVGFDKGALSFARENNIDCYLKNDSGFVKVG